MSIDTSQPSGDTSPDLLSVAVQAHGPYDVLTVGGEIDLATEHVLRHAISRLVDAGRTHLVVDLDEVDFIDSTGLGILLEAHRRTNELNGSLTIICHAALSTRLFEISGLDQVLTFDETVAAAVSR